MKLLVLGAPHETHRAYERHLYELARSLGLVIGEDVLFFGGLRDVRPAFAAMDLFVRSSVPCSEGAPAEIGEATMMERTVVATGVGGVREIVDDGVTVSIVPPPDPKAIATAALALFANPARGAKKVRQGLDRALAHFSVDQRAVAHATAYEHALRVRAARLDNSRP